MIKERANKILHCVKNNQPIEELPKLKDNEEEEWAKFYEREVMLANQTLF